MTVHLDELYFDWLYGQVCSARAKNPTKTYRELLFILHTKEFIWLIPNDDNRVEDAKDLRYEFLEIQELRVSKVDPHWLTVGVSIFEVLVALSRRFSFETDLKPADCFWEMLENVGVSKFNDRSDIFRDEVEDALDRVIWRTYNYNGGGGLFPLVYPEQDQRKVELWYQLNAYILEKY